MHTTLRLGIYASLAIVGLVATWYFNIRFMIEHDGFSLVDFVAATNANFAAASISSDILLAVLAFLVWSFVESRRLQMRGWWVYVLLTFGVAFAFSFPLFLFMRERALAAPEQEPSSEPNLPTE